MVGEERRREVGGDEGGMADEPAQEGQVRRHALDDGRVERLGQPVERLGAALAVSDQLRDHRVVGDADLVPLGDAGVDADPVRERSRSSVPA